MWLHLKNGLKITTVQKKHNFDSDVDIIIYFNPFSIEYLFKYTVYSVQFQAYY